MLNLSIDFETFSSVPITKAGAYKYVQSPDFEILLMVYSIDGNESEIIDLAQGEIRCFTVGLDATGKALGLAPNKQKLSVGKSLIRYFCVPCNSTNTNGQRQRNLQKHDSAKWELFKTYCKGDVITEMEIDQRLSAFPVPDVIINTRGVAVDIDLVQGVLQIGNSTY